MAGVIKNLHRRIEAQAAALPSLFLAVIVYGCAVSPKMASTILFRKFRVRGCVGLRGGAEGCGGLQPVKMAE